MARHNVIYLVRDIILLYFLPQNLSDNYYMRFKEGVSLTEWSIWAKPYTHWLIYCHNMVDISSQKTLRLRLFLINHMPLRTINTKHVMIVYSLSVSEYMVWPTYSILLETPVPQLPSNSFLSITCSPSYVWQYTVKCKWVYGLSHILYLARDTPAVSFNYSWSDRVRGREHLWSSRMSQTITYSHMLIIHILYIN